MAIVQNSAALLQMFARRGAESLQALRSEITNPHEVKTLRMWGIQEAARMVDRSPPTLKKAELEFPELQPARDVAGRRAYDLALINKYRDKLGSRYRRPDGSRPIVCAVTNFKGGAGKSTTAVHLAQRAALDGLRVLAIDLDPQATFTLHFGIIPDLDLDPSDTISHALVVNPADLSEKIVSTYFPGLDLAPANLGLQDAELQLANRDENNESVLGLGPIDRLRAALDSVQGQYDVVLLDCGPNLGVLTLNAINAATGLLIPIPPQMPDFGSARQFFESMSQLLRNPRFARPLDFVKVLISRHTGTTEASKVEALMRINFGEAVMQQVALESVEVERASNAFAGIYESAARGTEAYERAYRSIDGAMSELIATFRSTWEAQALASSVVRA